MWSELSVFALRATCSDGESCRGLRRGLVGTFLGDGVLKAAMTLFLVGVDGERDGEAVEAEDGGRRIAEPADMVAGVLDTAEGGPFLSGDNLNFNGRMPSSFSETALA